MKNQFSHFRWLVAVLVGVFLQTSVLPATLTWTNVSGGSWSTAANWQPNQVPGAADTAVISANGTYSVTLDTSPTLAGLSVGGAAGQQTLVQNGQTLSLTGPGTVGVRGVFQINGNLNCSGALTVQGAATWADGVINGSLSVASGGALTLSSSGGFSREFIGTLINAGVIHWSGGNFFLENASTLFNQVGGVIETEVDLQMLPSGVEPNRFINDGIFRKIVTFGGETSIGVAFENRGAVEVLAGRLSFPNGFTSRGNFTVADGARLRLSGGVLNLNAGHTFTGAGFYGIENGTVTIVGDLASPNFQLAGGTLNSTNRITGTLHWRDGVLRGGYTVAAGGSLILESAGAFSYEFSGTLTNAGVIHWSGGNLFLENVSTLFNQAGGVIETEVDLQMLSSGVEPNQFINEGVFRKIATFGGQTSIGVAFENRGTVEVVVGRMSFPNGFVSRGNFIVDDGARLRLSGGVFQLNAGHTFTGAGFYGIDGGTATIVGDLTSPNFQLAGGTLDSTNHITGTLHWHDGVLRGGYTVAAGGSLILENNGAFSYEFSGTLTNAGVIHWSGGNFFLENVSTLFNQAGGLIETEVDLQMLPSGVEPNRFINEGVFRKIATFGGQTSIGVAFENRGTVEVVVGRMSFPNGFVSRGNFIVDDGARLRLSGGVFQLNAGHTFTGAGFYGIDGGTATIVGDLASPNFQLTGGSLDSTNRITGTLHWHDGVLRGGYTVAAGGSLILESNGAFSYEFSGTLTNAGVIHWSGGNFFLENASTLFNQAGGLIENEVDLQMLPSGVEPNRFINEGIFRKSAGPGVTIIGLTLENRGTVEVLSGTLQFPNGYSQAAGSFLLKGGQLASSQPIQINGGLLGGNGNILGSVVNSGKVSPGASPGRLNIVGDYTQNAGGELIMELGGLTDDAFDQLVVSGAVTLGGRLSTPLIQSFVPTLNSTFGFLTAGSLTGQFAQHIFPTDQLDLQITYEAKSASVKVVNVFTVVSKFPPVLAPIAAQSVDEGALLKLTATATDADVPANILTFRLTTFPTGASIDPNTGVFTWIPTEEQGPGVYAITVRVTDNGALFDTKTFNVTVKEVNQPPSLAVIPPQLAAAGGTLKFLAGASDPDLPPQKLLFSLGAGAPPNASINATTGEFTWNVPASQAAGTVTVSVHVADDGTPSLSDSREVVIEIDRTGPRVLTMSPTGQLSKQVDAIDLTFDTPIRAASVDVSDAILTGPSGTVVLNSVSTIAEKVVHIAFNTLPIGNYTLKFGPGVTDLAGNPMNQDGDGINGEAVQDVFTGSLSVGLADLQTTAITLPASALIGQPIDIVWAVTNKGNTTAVAPWTDALILQQLGSETLLANVVHLTSLAPNRSMVSTQSVILPANFLGASFVVVRTDVGGEVSEGAGEANNETVSAKSILILAPDLIVTPVGAPVAAQFGQTVPVSWTVKNQGTGAALSEWVDKVYLATDASLAGSGRLLFSDPIQNVAPLAAGGSYTRTHNITLPLDASLTPGAYFFVIVTDAEGAQVESEEGNNSGNKPVTLSLPPLPDLRVRDLATPVSANPGQTVELRWTVTNQGQIPAVGPWTELVTLPDYPPLLSVRLTNTLAPGAFLTRTQTVTIPIDGPSGPVRFKVETDSDLEIAESNELNNATEATTATQVAARLTLSLVATSVPEDLAGGKVQGIVTRNGDHGTALSISLASTDPLQVTVPTTIQIPVGQVTALFDLTVRPDGLVKGPQTATITAAAAGYGRGSANLLVLDVDKPSLALTVDQSSLLEGTGTTGKVTRQIVTGVALEVTLESSDDAQLSVPATVIIPANQASVSFPVRAIDDTLIEATRSYTVSASASGFIAAAATLEIRDDDIPGLRVILAAHEVSEGGGAQATTATILRDAAGPRALVVELESSNENAARVPSQVTIPAGQPGVSFPVAAVDNNLVDGPKTAVIRAFVTDSRTGERLMNAVPDTLVVLDDDGPTLKLVIDRDLAAEGLNPGAMATLSRNTTLNSPLVVAITSSATTEATAPPTVTIPVGQASVTFPIATVDDGITDGDKTVTFQANAPGFTGGSAQLAVTDRNLPDLAVTDITVPSNGATDASFTVTLRVANNGLAAATGVLLQRVFLATSPVIGEGVLAGQAEFTGALAPGQHFEQTLNLKLPGITGDYWVVVTTDANNSVAEALENNNAAISPRPIRVDRTYRASIQTDVDVAPAGTPIPLRGQATLIGTQNPAPFSPVKIHITVRGTRRFLSATTDQDGRFSAVFQPLPGEAGSYEVGADHPGVSETSVQDRFKLLGLRATPPPGILSVSEGQSLTGVVNVENLSDVPLGNLVATVLNQPANLQVTLQVTNRLAGLDVVPLGFTITPLNTSVLRGIVRVRIASSEGVSAEVELPVAVQPLRPRLVADPASLVVGMKRGSQTSVQFDVSNTGGVASGDLDLLPPALPWLMVASGGRVASLAPGASTRVTLVLTPPADLPLGDHQGTIVISSATASVTVPFVFRSLSVAAGDLKITAVDEFTYYAEGSPNVAGAQVTITDTTTGAIAASGLTDDHGELLLHNLTEAYYRIDVRADGHSGFRNTSLLAAGKTNEALAFMNRETIQYIWKVVPTQIEDRTRIVIETVFETVVPFPVVTVDPMVIDLSEIQGDGAQIDYTISNHGLVAAEDTRIEFAENPNFSVTPLIGNIGRLAAQSSITIPVVIKRLKPGVAPAAGRRSSGRALPAADGGDPCDMRGATLFNAICGPVKRDYQIPLLLLNAKACGGSGGAQPVGGGFGERFGGGGGTGFEGGGGTGGGAYVAPLHVNSKVPCRLCPLATIAAAVSCVVPIAGDYFKNPSTAFEKDPTVKQISDLIDRSQKLAEALDKISTFTGGGPAPNSGSDATSGSRAALPAADPEEDQVNKAFDAVTEVLEGLGEADLSDAAKATLGKALSVVSIAQCAYGIATACDGIPNQDGSPRPISILGRNAHLAAGTAGAVHPEIAAFDESIARFRTRENLDVMLVGDRIWLLTVGEEVPQFLSTLAKRLKGTNLVQQQISSAERAELLAIHLPPPLTTAHANTLIDRWNRTIQYWHTGRLNLADVPAGQSTDFVPLDVFRANLVAAHDAILAAKAKGFGGTLDAFDAARQDLIQFYNAAPEEGSDCATVRLRIEQQAVITRDAFDASLEIVNSTGNPLEHVSVELSVRSGDGTVTTSLFGIRPPSLSGLSAVDGTGVIQDHSSGKASWIIIPSSAAAPTGPIVMNVSGLLKYTQGGIQITVPLAPAAITVLPNPILKVKYFNQRDVFADDPFTPEVEPSIPFSLGVLVQNVGQGTARNMRITSAQPKIVENEKGLLIDFEIIATEVAGQSLSPSLTANLGDIGPTNVAVARWLLRSSLQGLFTDYSATFEHLDGLGDPRLSLIESVEIHEMNHLVHADGAFEDGQPDFLVNDVPDLRDLPDTLYLSDGRIEPVALLTEAQVDAPPGPGHMEVILSAKMPPGWTYLQIPDPANGLLKLAHLRRANGSEMRLEDNVWTTDRTFVGNGHRPIHENVLHLLDFGGSQSYTLVYAEPPAADHTPPTSRVAELPPNSSVRIPVRWSGQDAGGGPVEFFDIFVSVDGGPFGPWLQKTTLNGSLYEGLQSSRYAFFSVATDHAGNREAAHGTPDAQTLINLINTAPKLTAPTKVAIDEGETLTVRVDASDADLPPNNLTFSIDPGGPAGVVIDPDTGVLTWVTGEGNGPSTPRITVRVTDNGVPSLSATAAVDVTVREVNQAPTIDPIAEHTISEGKKLTVTVTAQDPDLPANHLTFRLGVTAPPGTQISSDGVFTWTPSSTQGPSTNFIPIIVTDDGSPRLSATQTAVVIVRDALDDFRVDVGDSHLLGGQSGTVPVGLVSGVDLARLTLVVAVSDARVTNLTLQPLHTGISQSSLQSLGAGRFQLELDAPAGQFLPSLPGIAQLSFDTTAGRSDQVGLQVSGILGDTVTGTRVTRAGARDGRILVIGAEPILDAILQPTRSLILYGRPGRSYDVESAADLAAPLPWKVFTRVTLSETSGRITALPANGGAILFRARDAGGP